ncbi:MAG TPA: CDP-alcohol phosphatidyltransferase family protein [Chitinophagaceae bacterium]|nr:CDP-alcohol phosphatidyltransferase family protein [Chitinophagaceae bacterium]
MKQLPNLLTLGNLCCGCIALVCILQAPDFTTLYNGQSYIVTAPEPLAWGGFWIAMAAVFDFLDGLAARVLGAHSPLGKDLDSLSDLVSFGVAPGMILYQLLKISFISHSGAINTSVAGLLPALLVPSFCAVRLARFNQAGSGKDYFSGIPAPAAGLLVASFPLILLRDDLHLSPALGNFWILYAIIAVDCYFMVCRLPMISLKFRDLKWSGNQPRYFLIAGAIAGILLLGFAAVPAVYIFYIILSLIFKPLRS